MGLARSNWAAPGQSRTGGRPDTSDGNRIIANHVYRTTAESVDVKEGTSGGRIEGNRFDSTGMTGANYADSWVDVAGNGWTVRANVGTNPGSRLVDGYQTHVQLAGWGNANLFDANRSIVRAGGYAINVHTKGTGNVVWSTNTVVGRAARPDERRRVEVSPG